MAPLPILNLEPSEVKEIFWTKVKEPQSQRKLILVIVSIALLLDNMLYMVIVPIIPDYLRYIGSWGIEEPINASAPTTVFTPHTSNHHGQDTATGILFASKAIVQLMVNPFSGALIDRIGYDLPMMVGLIIMFLSTMVFACGRSYGMLFFARSLQGVGSAFADTSGLAMIADRFTEEAERTKALGIALAFISFGCLVAPPFGGALYQFAGKEVPFVILALISLMDGFMLLLVMKPVKEQLAERQETRTPSVPIWRLLMDPYIAVCAGALMMSNVALAFLEPTISLWMEDNLTTDNWKIGMVWLPAFFPHVFGVIITVKMAKQYPDKQWLMAAGGLALEGLCCFIIPFSTSYIMLMLPICGICFGIALIDTALLPMLGYLVDIRYVSVYGSIYAIADISYSLAYAVGPIIAGGVVEAIGFTALNFLIAFSNLLYVPVMSYLRNIYDFKHFENEANILMGDPPTKEYQTYTMHDQQMVGEEYKNHLEYGRQTNDDGNYQQQQETNLDSQGYSQNGSYQQQQQQQQQGGYQNYQPGYQEQGGSAYQQQQQQGPRHLPQQPQQPVANPFRHGDPQQQQQQQQQQQAAPSQPRISNPFRQGF
ncbi:vesicular acetylcholine transporter-like isoform X3 [Anopheles aquasalis]|uniref:vesicular acetylcholine transporter-like isoform X3 n=1 Tax=Anopheles aquasalis TaxID=42839 RepID=UPI00215AD4DF|nr:vesicular acetylcholine transporter-like isoform X3 [Anopheles aquasalis]